MKKRFVMTMLTAMAMSSVFARAQTPPQPNLDSLLAAVRDTMPAVRFKNNYQGGVKGNVSRVTLDNRVSSNAFLRNGWTITGQLGVSESSYRLQDRKDNSRTFSSTLAMPLGSGFNLNGLLSDSRFFNRIVTFGSLSQNFTNETQKADATISYARKLPYNVDLDAAAKASLSATAQTFQEDRGGEGAVRGRVRYWITDRIRVNSGGYISTSDRSATTATQREGGLGVNEDSLSTIVDVVVNDSSTVRVSYSRTTRTNEFLDQPQGVFGAKFEENLNREIETRSVTDMTIHAVLAPVRGFNVDVTGSHNENENDFAVKTTRFSRVVSDEIQGKLFYRLRQGTTFNVDLSNEERLNESSTSYTDKRRGMRFNLSHTFTNDFNVTAQTGMTILQTFYENFELVPRDRDQLDRFASLQINSAPFPKIRTGIYLKANQTEFVNIDVSLSGSNRKETTFDFRPDITYTISPKIEVRQTYGLNIEFTEFVYNENDNFLDRTFLFINAVDNRWTTRLKTNIEYRLRIHDRGSYLRPSPGAERLLDINQKDRRDEMKISFNYQINSHLALTGRNDYARRQDQFTSAKTTDGGIEIGIQGNYQWSEGRALKFNLRKVNRFGQFNSAEQEDYWIMDSTLTYAF